MSALSGIGGSRLPEDPALALPLSPPRPIEVGGENPQAKRAAGGTRAETGGAGFAGPGPVDPHELQAQSARVERRGFVERLVEDQLELKQDAERLAKNLLARNPPAPASALAVRGAELEKALSPGQAIPKDPVTDGRLSHFAGSKQERPAVKRPRMLLLGDAPAQLTPHRPRGAHGGGAVTVS